MEKRTMEQRGFMKSDMTDHEFAAYIKKHNLTYRQHLIGNVYFDTEGTTKAVVTFDNENITREIWVK